MTKKSLMRFNSFLLTVMVCNNCYLLWKVLAHPWKLTAWIDNWPLIGVYAVCILAHLWVNDEIIAIERKEREHGRSAGGS